MEVAARNKSRLYLSLLEIQPWLKLGMAENWLWLKFGYG